MNIFFDSLIHRIPAGLDEKLKQNSITKCLFVDSVSVDSAILSGEEVGDLITHLIS